MNGTAKGAPNTELANFRKSALGSFSKMYFYNFPDPAIVGRGDFSLSSGSDTTFTNGSLTFADLEIDTTGMNAPSLSSIFLDGSDVHATIVSAPTVGANVCEFTSWTCSDKENLLNSDFVINPVGCNDPMASNYCPYALNAMNCRYDTLMGSCGQVTNLEPIKEERLTVIVYPNPTASMFTLEISKPATINTQYSIYNLLGQKVSEGTISGTTKNIISSNWPKGVYYVQVGNRYPFITKRISKN